MNARGILPAAQQVFAVLICCDWEGGGGLPGDGGTYLAGGGREYLPWLGGRGMGYLPWPWGYLPCGGVPILTGEGGYLPWPGGYLLWLGGGDGYLPWLARGYLPWPGGGVSILAREVPTLAREVPTLAEVPPGCGQTDL